MPTVTYHHQPGIHETRGTIPVNGTAGVYTVSKKLWKDELENWLISQFIGKTLHLCCGLSTIGDVRVDLYADATIKADAARCPIKDKSFDTVLIDPPYNGSFQWNHDMLNELHRLARKRIIFQHWFSPVNGHGQFKKAHVFKLTNSVVLPVFNNAYIVPAVKIGDEYYVVEQDNNSDVFQLSGLHYWQPRTYFGRVQLISILDHEN